MASEQAIAIVDTIVAIFFVIMGIGVFLIHQNKEMTDRVRALSDENQVLKNQIVALKEENKSIIEENRPLMVQIQRLIDEIQKLNIKLTRKNERIKRLNGYCAELVTSDNNSQHENIHLIKAKNAALRVENQTLRKHLKYAHEAYVIVTKK